MIAWFHPFAGIAGDMALGALLDAGAPLDQVRDIVAALGVEGWRLDVEPVQRAGLAATRAVVHAPEDGPERRWRDIDTLLAAAALPPRVAERARRTFQALAAAEGQVHGIPPADVHFHEVGALDAIVDVVGTCAALEVLGVAEVWSGPVAVGTGLLRSAHGTLPNPAPAVTVLLAGAPVRGLDEPLELTTPTGAALLAALVTGWGPLPGMQVVATGHGAGTRDTEGRPNVTQVVLGHSAVGNAEADGTGQPLRVLEANVDDATGEVLAHTVARLLEAGALDAWVTPVVMKKGRPAHTVHALCDPARTATIATVLVAETGSLGVRGHLVERWALTRDEAVVDVGGHPVRMKVAAGRAKPEADDAAAAARALGLPLREVLARADAAFREPPPY